MSTHQEQQLEFSFPDNVNWEKLDRSGAKLPNGMSFVDLIIIRSEDLLMVEIKDPSNSRTPDKERQKYLIRLQNNEILTQELTPKARDSYTFLHLMMRDDKPIKYIVLLGLDAFGAGVEKALLTNFKDRLLGDIQNECDVPWKRQHVADCAVLSIDDWNKYFADWPVKRMSSKS